MTIKPQPQNADVDPIQAAETPRRTGLTFLLGLVLLTLAIISGAPDLDATWIQGDEQRFIANNPDVTGEDQSLPRWQQHLNIFAHAHDDLYQPIPILSYALEWDLWGAERVTRMRTTDVLLHAVNGLLLWGVLCALLRRFVPQADSLAQYLISFALALIWTLHPINVSAYAADMGRTHILSAGFLLLAVRAHLATLDQPNPALSASMIAALLAANLCKPVVGWVAVVALLEVHALGWSAMSRSWRVWTVGFMGIVAAILTLSVTQHAQMLESITSLLYGDRFSRSLFAVWLHLYNITYPATLSMWYLPDARSVWSHPLVWIGGLLTLISLLALLIAFVRRAQGITIGIVWFWIVLLPVLGLVGARVASGNDRYVYVPFMGVMLILAIILAQLSRRGKSITPAAAVLIAAGLSAIFIPMNMTLTATARSTVSRAMHNLRLYPNQRLAFESLTMAYVYAAQHDTTIKRELGETALLNKAREALDQTVAIAETHPEQFVTISDKAAFHRRMALRYMTFDALDEAEQHAERAAKLEPGTIATLTSLAQTRRSRQDWTGAAEAYAQLEPLLTPGTPYRTLRYIEYADLLLNRLNRPGDALTRYREALADESLDKNARNVARRGLALAEIRAGEGSTGYAIASELIAQNPDDSTLLMILGEYYLRSHLFEQSLQSYGRVVTREPTNHRGLRGLHAAAAELGEYDLAAKAWARAMQLKPEDHVSRSFLVWALASGADPKAEAACDLLLTNSPEDAFGHFSRMLIAIRQARSEQAIEHMQTGLACPAQLETPEAAYAATTLERLSRRHELPSIGYLFAAAIWNAQGASQRAHNALICFHAGSSAVPTVSGQESQTTSQPTGDNVSPSRATHESSEYIERLGLETLSQAVLESNQSNSINCY